MKDTRSPNRPFHNQRLVRDSASVGRVSKTGRREPLEFVTRTTGMLTLVFLLISLAVSPLRRIPG